MDVTADLGTKIEIAEQDAMAKLTPLEQNVLALVGLVKSGFNVNITISVTPKKEQV